MSPRPNTVLVTGAGGFVGSAVVRAMVQAMQGPTGGPTFSDGQSVAHVVALLRPNADASRLESLPPGAHWSVVRANLGDPGSSAALAAVRPRAVLHLALDPACHEARTEAERRALIEPPLIQLFDVLQNVPGSHLVATGSAAVLAPGAALDELSPTAPNPAYPCYARAKLLEEDLLERFGSVSGVRVTNLRLFYLFGRYERNSRLLPYLVRTLARGNPAKLSEGTQLRDYTDVDDAALAYLRALAAAPRSGCRHYHVGSGRGYAVRDLAETVAAVVGRPDLLRFGSGPSAELEGHAIVADVRRIREELGWSAPDPLPQLRRATEWYLARERGSTDHRVEQRATIKE